MSARRRLTLLTALLACTSPEADTTGPDVRIEFPPGDGELPLNATDGLPFIVQVSARLPQLQNPVKARVTVLGGPTAAGPPDPMTVIRDASVVLLPDGADGYSALVTLNAFDTGTVTVRAEVAGTIKTGSATIRKPEVHAVVAPTAIWSGSAPRYSICVETAAAKGTVILTADDPVVFGDKPSPSATVVPRSCSLADPDASISHASFTLSAVPPYNLVASLAGRPITADPALWSVPVAVDASLIPSISLAATRAPTSMRSAVGTIFVVTATATSGKAEVPVAGMTLMFKSLAPDVSVAPTSATTDVNGQGKAFLLVPYDRTIAVEVTGGTAYAETTVTGEHNPIALVLTAEPTTMAVGDRTIYLVTANATIGGAPIAGADVAFSVLASTDSDTVVVPAKTATDTAGDATASVAVPLGGQVAVAAVVGSASDRKIVVIDGMAPSPP